MSALDEATVSAAAHAPGVMLREARERAGLSQDDIANKLKLAPRQITAIETGDWNSLPERTFTRGFMRSYARLVGLDPDIVGLDRSPSQPNAGGELKPTPDAIGEIALEIEHNRAGAARWAVPLLLVAVLAAGVAYFQWGELIGFGTPKTSASTSQSNNAKTVPAKADTPTGPIAAMPSPSTSTEPAAAPTLLSSGSVIAPAASGSGKDAAAVSPSLLPPADNAASPASPAATAAAMGSLMTGAPGDKRITITFKGKSWTEVRSKGDVIYSEASLPGTKEFNGKPPLSFIVGNASNVVLSIDGKPYDMSALTRNDVARFRIE